MVVFFSAVLTPFFGLRPVGRRVPALRGLLGALDGQPLLLIEGSRVPTHTLRFVDMDIPPAGQRQKQQQQ